MWLRFSSIMLLTASAAVAAFPSEWRHRQDFDVPSASLVKISLPSDTLNAARPGLEDLRVWDDSGELPYWIDRPAPVVRAVSQAVKSFNAALNDNSTAITIETGAAKPIDHITIETPGTHFVKAVRIEGSSDGTSWKTLGEGVPIFRQWYGVDQLRIPLPPGVWPWIRLTVDDRRSQPVPFVGARLDFSISEPAPAETQSVNITERDENPGETRLTLNLGAANLSVASVEFDTPDPLFARNVIFAVPEVTENGIVEKEIGRGLIYRVGLDNQPTNFDLSIPLETLIPSRELIARIQNFDSPPLFVTSVRIRHRPVYLVFMCRHAGTHHLFTGNPRCATPQYDVSSLSAHLRDAAVSQVQISPIADNPDFHAPETLPGVELTGAPLDASDWQFRKVIQLKTGQVHQIELDAATLAHCAPNLADLRIVSRGNQVPYLIQRTSIDRPIALNAALTNDAQHPRLSRWLLRTPQAGIPISRLTCVAQSPLFQRQLILFENLTDDRGEKYRRNLAGASWTRTPGGYAQFAIALDTAPQSDTLFLETDNGDNPPLELAQFTAYYPVTRLLFKAQTTDPFFLYYGNPNAPAAQYDINLVASQLFSADRDNGSLGAEEQLQFTAKESAGTSTAGGFIFWGMLAVVVIVLLVVIARLLPKPPPPC